MYPIQLNIKDKHIVIVGGGRIAFRKFQKVKNEAKHILVVSPSFQHDFSHENTEIITDSYKKEYLRNADLIFAATDDETVNNQIKKDAKPSQLVNHTGDANNSDFHNMMTFSYEDMEIHITSKGKNYVGAKALAKKIQEFLKNEE